MNKSGNNIMDEDEASRKLVKHLIKANLIALTLSSFTGIITNLFTALMAFPIYLYLAVSFYYIKDSDKTLINLISK